MENVAGSAGDSVPWSAKASPTPRALMKNASAMQ